MAWLLVAAPAPAWAHAELVSSSPGQGDVLDAAPQVVDLVFSEPILASTVAVAVVAQGASPIPVTDVTVEATVVTVAWPADAATGPVAVNYRVVSEDGHPITGSVGFTIGADASAQAPTPAPTPARTPAPSDTAAPTPEPAGSAGISPIAAISLGLAIGIAVGFVLLLRRRSKP